MRFRLGLLQDTAAINKLIAKEAADAQAKKHKHDIPTAKTEAQTKAGEVAKVKRNDTAEKGEKVKEQQKPPRIKPLSEAKAIELGANFVSETFLLAVGVALIIGENWRQGRKETSRREDVSGRIGELEEYNKTLREEHVVLEEELRKLLAKAGMEPPNKKRILSETAEREEREGNKPTQGWFSWIKSLASRETPGNMPEAENSTRTTITKAFEVNHTSRIPTHTTTAVTTDSRSSSRSEEGPNPTSRPLEPAVTEIPGSRSHEAAVRKES